MTVTPDHPVYVEGQGWVWAENLAVGDRLRRADGGWVRLAEPQDVYNKIATGQAGAATAADTGVQPSPGPSVKVLS